MQQWVSRVQFTLFQHWLSLVLLMVILAWSAGNEGGQPQRRFAFRSQASCVNAPTHKLTSTSQAWSPSYSGQLHAQPAPLLSDGEPEPPGQVCCYHPSCFRKECFETLLHRFKSSYGAFQLASAAVESTCRLSKKYQ